MSFKIRLSVRIYEEFIFHRYISISMVILIKAREINCKEIAMFKLNYEIKVDESKLTVRVLSCSFRCVYKYCLVSVNCHSDMNVSLILTLKFILRFETL